MAEFNIPLIIQDDKVLEVRDVLAEEFGYVEGETKETKVQVIHSAVRNWLKDIYITHRVNTVKEANRIAEESLVQDGVDSELQTLEDAKLVNIDIK